MGLLLGKEMNRADRLARELAERPVVTERVQPVAHLGAWGVTEEGRRWGIVALPKTWHNGDTLLLDTKNAKLERKP